MTVSKIKEELEKLDKEEFMIQMSDYLLETEKSRLRGIRYRKIELERELKELGNE